jgi:RNA polymerase sigma factor (sigma-70 family)
MGMAMDPTADVRFTRIYETHYAEVLAYCARRVDRTEAEDVANEVFTVLWRKIETVQDETLAPWLYGVAYRTITNRWRGSSRQRNLKARLSGLRPETPDAVDTIVVRRDEDSQVLAAIAKLKPDDREVLRLSAWEALNAPQIAEVLGCSVSAAEQRLHRAKKRLAKVLTPIPSPSIATIPLSAEEGGRR